MNPIGGKRRAGSFVAFGTDECILPPFVHYRIVVTVARDGFVSVALTAGNFSPHCMQAPGLLRMAADARSVVVKSEAHMGIGQIFSEPDLLGCRRQGNQFCPRPGIPDMRQIKPRFGLISLIASCTFFSTCIPISLCGNFFLGSNHTNETRCKDDDEYKNTDQCTIESEPTNACI